MLPVLHGDVTAAARVLRGVPVTARAAVRSTLIRSATWASLYRQKHGRQHPCWGDGTLMAAALARDPAPEPGLGDADYCWCLALVLSTLARRQEEALAGQADRT